MATITNSETVPSVIGATNAATGSTALDPAPAQGNLDQPTASTPEPGTWRTDAPASRRVILATGDALPSLSGASASGSLTMGTVIPIAPPSARLWQGDDVVKVALKAPFEQLFARRAELALGPVGVDDGEVTLQGPNGAITATTGVRIRGQSSVGDLDFLKLKLRIKGPVAGTAFEGVSSIEVGTHGGDRVEPTAMGRLGNEKAAHREAAVYNVLEELGLPVMQVRAGKITYEDRGTGTVKERDAFFIEDVDDLAKRLGGTKIDISETGWKGTIRSSLGYEQALRVSLGNVLTGVQDWELSDGKTAGSASNTWNMKFIQLPNRKQVAVPSDYDTATMVTGASPSDIDHLSKEFFFPLQSDRFRQFASAIVDLRTNWLDMKPVADRPLARRALEQLVADFKSRKEYVLERLKTVPMDDAGRAIAFEHVHEFYSALEAAINLPLLARETVAFYGDSHKNSRLNIFSAQGAPLEILERDAARKMVKVRLLEETRGPREAWVTEGAVTW
jgi:hypothetical protein